jgi:uncharacterized heparinase superfamily protein
MLKRLLTSLRGSRQAVAAGPAAAEIDFAGALRDAGLDAGRWVAGRLARRALYPSIGSASIEHLRQTHGADVDAAIRAAERILKHEFDLLGSGGFVPVDPDRIAASGYTPIDWYLDPVRGLRFPKGVPHKEWKLYEMRPGNADIKYPWELARCQHWIALGQAFRLSRDERFALEIARELDDFVESNPVATGVNWTCTMDVALRAVSWAIGLELVHDSGSLESGFWTRAYSALFDHGVFIRGNLENTYEVTSNHFLSNVVGLLFLGAVFADLPNGAEWNTFARTSLETEINVQVLPDGADFESSIPYHRLVTELFLGSARLADFQGKPLSDPYCSRVRDMVAYLAVVIRPDGLMPQVGDADDGRLHVMGGYGTTTPQDGRHLFGPAAVMFDEPVWACLGGDRASWETTWWGLTPTAAASSKPEPASRLYADAGVAVMRAGDSHYLLVTNGRVGTAGFGNHKHNDQLSFEYHHGGVPLIVDPGSGVYTSDAETRNRFRATASHNTLQIDGIEQNEINPEWLFRMFESSKPEHVSFDNGANIAQYVGRHHGYERLPDPVTHERVFLFQKPSGSLTITDRLLGAGRHTVRWHFHLAPGVKAEPIDARAIMLSASGRSWLFQTPSGVAVSLEPADYSPSYGVSELCTALDCEIRTAVDGERTFEFSVEARS